MVASKLEQLQNLIERHASESNYNASMFFKTAPGQYAEHDRFLGIKNPVLRILAKQFFDLSYDAILVLLYSVYNEERALALMILMHQYQKGDSKVRQHIFNLYVEHINQVNNWNLVDLSAHVIVGAHVYHGLAPVTLLDGLIVSDNLWHRRIGIIAPWYHIRQKSVDLTMSLAQRLLHDKHDLMHKAVGWMLREAGKKHEVKLRRFLDQYVDVMPRTALRYALERFDRQDQLFYLKR